MYKVAVAGSRKLTGDLIKKLIIEFIIRHPMYPNIEILTGDAFGVDRMAAEAAFDLNLTCKFYKAYWEEYGKAAGVMRSRDMVEACDEGLVIWDGKSKGTRHTINFFKEYEKDQSVVWFDYK